MIVPDHQVLEYGKHPDQFLRCRAAVGEQRGTAVLVHGGYWREIHTLDLMNPLAQDLHKRGWATVNVEYRRGSQAAWPTPLLDLREACRVASRWAISVTAPKPLIGIGHSVGGQLALLAGDPLDAVVALAPVTNAARTHAEQLGENAAQEYFRASPASKPEIYADASPLARLPVNRPTMIVHGHDDGRVPMRHSLDFLVASLDHGDDVTGHFMANLNHLKSIAPEEEHWQAVTSWMNHQASAVTIADA